MTRSRMKASAVGALLLGTLLLSGCGIGGCGRTEPAAEMPVYAVADTDRLFRAHPDYAGYLQAEEAYRNLAAEYDADRQRLIRTATQAERELHEQLSSGAIENELNEKFRAQMQVREAEWNTKLELLYRELVRDAAKPLPPTTETDLRIVNLQLQLRALQLSEAERREKEEELAALLAGKSAAVWPAAELDSAAQAQLDALKAQAEQDLEAYAAELTKNLSVERDAAQKRLYEAAQQRLAPVDGAGWNAEWQQRLAAKKRELAAREGAIRTDVEAAATAVGEREHITMIFGKYRTNLTARDVTEEIAAKLREIKGGKPSGT